MSVAPNIRVTRHIVTLSFNKGTAMSLQSLRAPGGTVCSNFKTVGKWRCRSRWPRGLWRKSAAARLLGLWVRIPPGAWTFVCCECCVLSGRGLCDELTTRPEESYRLWCVVVCDLETSLMRRPWPTGGCCANKKQTNKGTWRWWGCHPYAPAAPTSHEISLGLSRPQGRSAAGGIKSMKNANDHVGNRTRDLPACSAVPQSTAPPHGPSSVPTVLIWNLETLSF